MIITTTIIHQKQRVNELLTCIKKNLDIDIINKYVIFYEKTPQDITFLELLKKFDNLDIVYIDFRPSIKYMIEYLNKHYKNQTCILTNSDILFDNTLNLLQDVDFNKCSIALTRYNVLSHTNKFNFNYAGHTINYNYHDATFKLKTMHTRGQSIDAWIFNLPLKHDNIDIDFPLGTYNGDGYLNYQLSINTKLFNPVYDIISIHLHKKWNPNSYNNINHSSRTFWKKKYIQHELPIPFCHIKQLPKK